MDYLIGIYIGQDFYEYIFINLKGKSLYRKIEKSIKFPNMDLMDEIGTCILKDCEHFDKNGCKGIGLLGLTGKTHKKEIQQIEQLFPNIQVTVCESIGLAKCLALGAYMRQSVVVLLPEKLCMMTPEESNGHPKYSYIEMMMAEAIEFDWMADMLFSDLGDIPNKYKQMDLECDHIPDGAKGLYYEIDSSGERSFVGIQKFHNRGCFLKAVYETWALFILDRIEKEAAFLQVTEIIFAQEKLLLKNWLQTVANITGKIILFQPADLTMGAALYAGMALDVIKVNKIVIETNREHVFKPQEYTLKI